MLAGLCGSLAIGHAQSTQTAGANAGVHVVSVNGYPELRVDGRPFFVNAAQFDYFRIPRDLWSKSLDRYRQLGINTIDLRIPWNWHEPKEGEFDFDGHTNSRRDLHGLLELISQDGFRLIARPGPTIGDEWRNGGYPDWMLSRAEFEMSKEQDLSGLYPPGERLAHLNAEAGAALWLANATHLQYARLWLAAVAKQIAPYASNKTPGNLLFVILDDSAYQAGAGLNGGKYAEYLKAIRDALAGDGVEAIFAVAAAYAQDGVAPSVEKSGIFVTGDWFSNDAAFAKGDDGAKTVRLRDSDAQRLSLLTQTLRTKSSFPAILSDFQAGWFTPADDAQPKISPPANTLLASRWLMAQGLGGIEYSPLQETLTPPGYEVASVNREFRWDAALDLSGEPQPRAHALERNAKMLEMWSEFLASAHPRPEIGLVDWRSGLFELDRSAVEIPEGTLIDASTLAMKVERVAELAGNPMAMVDPANQPADVFRHYPVLLLIIPDSLRGRDFLPERTQKALLEYVRQGGTLLCNPERPAGQTFDEQLRGIPTESDKKGLGTIKLGSGKIVFWSKDFYSWADTDESFAASLERQEANWAISELQAVSQSEGLRPPVIQQASNVIALRVAELLPNAQDEQFGAAAKDCASHPRCVAGLLSATNWSGDAVQETLKILSPGASAMAAANADYTELPVQIPAHESLMLPLNFPLCSSGAGADGCPDRIVAAGAELLNTSRDTKALTLTFYAPTTATILMHLRSAPTKVDIPAEPGTSAEATERRARLRERGEQAGRYVEGIPIPPDPREFGADFPERNLEGRYDKATGIYEVVMPRGAAPDFSRKIEFHLNYVPDVPEEKKPAKQRGRGYQYSVADAVRLPLGEGTSLPTDPPLILLDKDRNGQLLLQASNLDDSSLTLQGTVSGPAQGSESLQMDQHQETIETVKLRASGSPDPADTTLLAGSVNVSGGHGGDRSSPVRFLVAEDATPVHYEYDFERSGSPDWVLENNHLRLIVQPAAGGEIVALVEKQSGVNLTTTSGSLRDLMQLAKGSDAASGSLLDMMFNVPYFPDWRISKNDAAIHLTAVWPKSAPLSGEIEKTIRMFQKDERDAVEVEYQFHPAAAAGDQRAEAAAAPVSAFSVPAIAQSPETTQFCWFAGADQKTTQSSSQANSAQPAPTCVPFVPAGAPIVLPAETRRLEIRSLGRPTLGMEWTAGRVALEQKQFSARVLFEIGPPPGKSASANWKSTLRYTVQWTQ